MKCTTFFSIFLILTHTLMFSQGKKINGLSFVASRDSITQKHALPVVRVNANYAALMPFGFIKSLSTPEIIHNTDRQWFGETEKGVMQYGHILQKNNIHLMIKPQLWVWNGEFTGRIKMNSEEAWVTLENSYEAFIITYALTAEKLNAAVLCIGTELEEFVKARPLFWKKLIKNIRNIYSGKLTYAANWDEYKRVSFWNELDYIGIDAYFPLTDQQFPSIADFEAGWKPHKASIITLQKRFQKPVLFTEYGYRSVDFTGKKPWEANHIENAVNLNAQANGLQAIHNQFWDEDWFAGGFIWKWFHNHAQSGGFKNNRFTPQNKPAESILKRLYHR